MTLRKSPAPAKVHPPLFLLYLGSPAQVRVECVKRDAAVVLGGHTAIMFLRVYRMSYKKLPPKIRRPRRCADASRMMWQLLLNQIYDDAFLCNQMHFCGTRFMNRVHRLMRRLVRVRLRRRRLVRMLCVESLRLRARCFCGRWDVGTDGGSV